MRRSLALVLVLGLSACGAGESSGDGGRVGTTPITVPSTGVTSTSRVVSVTSTTTTTLARLPAEVLDDPLVRFQADWFCQSSKTAYASAADIDSALGVRLASAGIDRAVYDAFVATLGVDNLRRAGVLQLFLQTCH
jgi:hypothetical protein